MSVVVRHRNNTIAVIPDSTGGTKTLRTEGKYLDSDVQVIYTPPAGPNLGTKIITENGLYDASDEGYDGYSEIDVSVAGGGAVTQDQDGYLVLSDEGGGGGGGYTDYEILTGEAPEGEVSIVLSENLPRFAISAKKNITKLTVDMNGHGFEVLNGNANTFCNNQIPVYHLKNSDNSTRNVEGYVFSDNRTKTGFAGFIVVISGYGWVQLTSSALRNNNALKLLDYTYTKPLSTSLGIRQTAFMSDSIFDTMIIRSTEVMGLGNIDAFSATPFASNGTGGTLYVPNSLISSYQAASNWSTILGYANNQIKSIESTHTDPNALIDLTTHYADGTLIQSA